MRILVTGSSAYDIQLNYEGSFSDGIKSAKLNHLNLAFVTRRYKKHHGGTGANIAWNLNLLGGDPLLVSTVGSDGGPFKALFDERGINVDHMEQVNKDVTATALIGTDSNEHQIIFYHPGADAYGTWPDLSDDRDDLVYAIVSPREESVMLNALEWCTKFGVPVLFDPGQRLFSISDDELKRAAAHCDGIIGNAFEWSLLEQKLGRSPEDWTKDKSLVILTQGEEGLTVFVPGETLRIPACKADQVMNPTGAGDALRAGLLHGISKKWSLLDSARLGAALASFVVEIEGTMLDTLDLDVLRERARKTYKQELPAL